MQHRAAATIAGLLALSAGCTETPTTNSNPGIPSRIIVASGDAQMGAPGTPLNDVVRFEVIDADGRPVPGTDVTIVILSGGGSVTTSHAVTDLDGIVAIAWSLGSTAGRQQIEAHVTTVVAVRSAATACAGECDPPPPLDQISLVPLETYEGSGQAVHPDVLQIASPARVYWLAATPYPDGNANYENPSIFLSTDATRWTIPDGASNPVERPDPGAYLSDPDMLFDSGSNEFWLYYREVTGGLNEVLVARSQDGVAWSKAEIVAAAPSHQIVSPTVVRGSPAAPWVMWSVNSGPAGCGARTTGVERRTSDDGIAWSAPAPVALVQPGENIWHIDVQWVPSRGEYWAVYNTYVPGTSCTTDALYLAVSGDGVQWTTFPSPIVQRGVIAAFSDVVYRSTFLVDPAAGTVAFWFSGATYSVGAGYTWRIATETRRVADLLATVQAPVTALRAPQRRDLPPPEPDVGPGR